MVDEAEVRAVFRRIVHEGGDVVDLADVARARGWGGPRCLGTARALRDEFGLDVVDAVRFAAWIELGDERTGADRDELRAAITTPLR